MKFKHGKLVKLFNFDSLESAMENEKFWEENQFTDTRYDNERWMYFKNGKI